jgi:hypothetical protein
VIFDDQSVHVELGQRLAHVVVQLVEFNALRLGAQVVNQGLLGPLDIDDKLPSGILPELPARPQERRKIGRAS